MSWRRRGAPGQTRTCGRCGATGARSRKTRPAVTMCDVDGCHVPLCAKHAVWDSQRGAFTCRKCQEDVQPAAPAG